MTIGLSTVVAAWAILQAGAVPPPAEQFTADCGNPVFATDKNQPFIIAASAPHHHWRIDCCKLANTWIMFTLTDND